jgi:hypothetical protein
MARDWNDTESTRQDILKRMAEHGTNIADMPYCETMERRSDEHIWVIDLHVKVAKWREFDISAEDLKLSEALRKAYLSLSHEPVRSKSN